MRCYDDAPPMKSRIPKREYGFLFYGFKIKENIFLTVQQNRKLAALIL
jgi:hypothetical protein